MAVKVRTKSGAVRGRELSQEICSSCLNDELPCLQHARQADTRPTTYRAARGELFQFRFDPIARVNARDCRS